ncbi:MAG: hypothetical protein PHV54_00890 [Tolumonas sp.]|nr:hypothetical protein [Tolumonas sp.]
MLIKKIASDCGEPNLPQEIYEACLKKQAFLFVRDRAWFVLKTISDCEIPGVLVWAAISERTDGLNEYTDLVKFLSIKINARFIRFHTVRKGFIRVASKYGWQRKDDDSMGRMIFEMTL